MMKTGFGESSGEYENTQSNALIGIVTPVIEKSLIIACQYCKACGRTAVTAEDMEYAVKFCVMHTVGESIGSIVPEIYDEEESDEDDIEELTEDECPPFTRYTGQDLTFTRVNAAYDRWDEWEPQNPVEEMLKNAINSNEYIGAGGVDDF